MILVSAIMPTRGRREWAAKALTSFLAQTYPNKELIIVDDSQEPSFPVAPRYRNVSHIFSDSRLIPEKRNLGARLATGQVLCHWDSDDWSAPTRIEEQVRHFEESQKPVVGFHSMLFYDEETRVAYYYFGNPKHAIGTSLCYLKTWWDAHPFTLGPREDPNVGEDCDFSKAARDLDEIDTRPCDQTMVARIHSGNTSKKDVANPCQMEYRHVSVGSIPAGFFQ